MSDSRYSGIESHFLAATAEWMNLHVDFSARNVSPWPDEAGKQMKVANPIFFAAANN